MSGIAEGALTAPPARMAISIRGRFDSVVSRVAQRGTLDRARVHAKSSRELRQMIGIPHEPKRDRDEARLSETGGWQLLRFSDEGDEVLIVR